MDYFQQQADPEIFENPIFSMHLKGIRLSGYITKPDSRFKLWYFLLSTALTISFVALTILLVYLNVARGFKNLDGYAICWATSVLYITSSVTFLNAYFQRKRLVNMMNFIQTDLQLLQSNADNEEKKIFQETIRYLRIIMVIMLIPATIAIILVVAECLYYTIFHPDAIFNNQKDINSQPTLMFKLYPFRELSNNFIIAYIAPWYSFTIGVYFIPNWPTFMTCFMKYITFKFEIMCKRMKNLDIAKINNKLKDINDVLMLSEDERNYWLMKLCEYCVEEKIKIRWFIKEFQRFIYLPTLMDFVIFSMLICMLLYALLVGNPSLFDCMFFCLYIFTMGWTMWLYHWHCTLIAESNNQLQLAIYSSDWYMQSKELQKAIYMLLIESNRPLVMRAIFVELNIKSFIQIVRGAFSYFSILRKVNLQ